MNKLKTNSGAKKRFKLTKNGKVKRSNACKRHLLVGKTTKRKRHLRKATIEATSVANKVKKMLPYAS
jgi:large subunit ribosomal protein L35